MALYTGWPGSTAAVVQLSGTAHPWGFSKLTVVVNVVVPEHDVDGASGLVPNKQIRQAGAVGNELFPRLLALHSRAATVGVKTHLGRDARSRDGVTSISVRGGDSGTIDGARQRGNECSSGPHGVGFSGLFVSRLGGWSSTRRRHGPIPTSPVLGRRLYIRTWYGMGSPISLRI